jgi:hypothetical protein
MAKTTNPIIRIHDLETDEVIDRQMTDVEFAEYQANKALHAEIEAKFNQKEIDKSAILDRIGLTADELKTILG